MVGNRGRQKECYDQKTACEKNIEEELKSLQIQQLKCRDGGAIVQSVKPYQGFENI
jgi:hypothetical protein